jgi:GT2 family glycosyltransferase
VTDTVPFGVVVVNLNAAALTIECLESLRVSNPNPKAVVLVDNHSTDNSVADVIAWSQVAGVSQIVLRDSESDAMVQPSSHAWLTIITASHNGGFSVGNNIGLRYLAKSPDVTHFFLLNNDATVEPEYFRKLSDALRSSPDAGLVSGTIYAGDPAAPVVWYAGGHEIPWRALVVHDCAVPSSAGPISTEMVCGCTMLISRRLFERLGQLPECYALVYGEDAEYSNRARKAGFQVLYAPAAAAHHKVGATVGPAALSPMVTFCQNRHRAFFVRRNYRGITRATALSYLFVTKPGRAVVDVLRGRPRIAWATLSGMLAGIFSNAARE